MRAAANREEMVDPTSSEEDLRARRRIRPETEAVVAVGASERRRLKCVREEENGEEGNERIGWGY